MACAACRKQRQKLANAAKRGDVKGTVKMAVQGVKMMTGRNKGKVIKAKEKSNG